MNIKKMNKAKQTSCRFIPSNIFIALANSVNDKIIKINEKFLKE